MIKKNLDIVEYQDKKYLITQKKREKQSKISDEARIAAAGFLEKNPDVNIGYLIEHLQSKILSTTQCCDKLGISPSAFLRLRKKYNIEPIYSLKNNVFELNKSNKKFLLKNISNKAIKNFYNPKQLEIFSENEINTIQVRAARSFKFPNGNNVGWSWTSRGYHVNGKLKARMDNLKKLRIRVFYYEDQDKYSIDFEGYRNKFLSRKEIDDLNFRIAKLKAFL